MSLEEDDVAVVVVALALEEMVEADFVERCGRRERRNVSANAVVGLVRLDDHCERVPADEALDPALDFAAAGKRWFFYSGDRVDVRSVGGEGLLDALAPGMIAELLEQTTDAGGSTVLQDVIERLEPFAGLERIELGRIF